MLEIIALVLLCNVNSKNAAKRGRKPGLFVLMTLVLWIGLEFVGAVVGSAADLEMGAYVVALLFAVCGGIASYFITKNCKPGTYFPQGGVSQPGAGAWQLGGEIGTGHGGAPAAAGAPAPTPAPTAAGAPAPTAAPTVAPAPAPAPTPAPTAAPMPAAAPANATTFAPAPAPAPAGAFDPSRATVAGIVFAAGWVALFLVQGLMREALGFNTFAGYLTAMAMLGIGAYLFSLRDRRYTTAGVVFGAASALAYSLSAYSVQAAVFLPGGVYLGMTPLGLAGDILVRLLVYLVCAALTLGAVLLVQRRVGSATGASMAGGSATLGGSAAARRPLAPAVAAGLTVLVFVLLASLIMTVANHRAIVPLTIVSALLSAVSDGVVVFLAMLFAGKLCSMPQPKLRLRGIGLVWAWVALCASALTAIGLVLMVAMQTPNINYASAFVVAICGIVGYVMLVCGRREGLYVVVGGTVLLLISQLFAATSGLATETLSGYSVAGSTASAKDYVSLILSSIFGCINPLLAWLSVRYSSSDVFSPDFASREPVSRSRATAFDMVAAVCNIIVGLVVIFGMVVGMAEARQAAGGPVMVLLIGVLFVVIGIATLALRRPKSGEFPAALRVTGIVFFAVDVIVLLATIVALLQSMYHIF